MHMCNFASMHICICMFAYMHTHTHIYTSIYIAISIELISALYSCLGIEDNVLSTMFHSKVRIYKSSRIMRKPFGDDIAIK